MTAAAERRATRHHVGEAKVTDNEALVRRMMEFYSQMDGDGIRSVLHPEARHTAPGSDFGADMQGRDTIVAYFRNDVFPSFERVRFDVVFLWEVRERSAVVVEWRSHLSPKTGKT